MAVVKNPIPVSFSPDTTTRVLFQVPCIVEGIDVKQKLDAIDSALASVDTTSLRTSTNISNNISSVSSSISASIGDLTNIVNDLAATIPTPGGPLNAVQYKTGAHSLGGSADFIFNPVATTLGVGLNISIGNDNQVGIGKNNTTDNSTSLFVVGNGTDTGDRYDAFKIENYGSKLSQVVHGGGIVNKVRIVRDATVYLLQSDYYIHTSNSGVTTAIILPLFGTVKIGTTYIIKVGAENENSNPIELHWDTNQYLDRTPGPGFTTATSGQMWRIIKYEEGAIGGITCEFWETW
jgi:hypothetical protein